MAGEHDFAPLSDEAVDFYVSRAPTLDSRHMAREIRASRAAMRALVEAEDVRDAAQRDNHTRRYADAVQEIVRTRTAIRALVAHVGAEGEGR